MSMTSVKADKKIYLLLVLSILFILFFLRVKSYHILLCTNQLQIIVSLKFLLYSSAFPVGPQHFIVSFESEVSKIYVLPEDNVKNENEDESIRFGVFHFKRKSRLKNSVVY